MNSELVLRLIALVQKNGDRVVLADPESGEGVVVMDLSSYEKMNAALESREGSVPPPRQRTPAPRRYGREAPPADDGLFESVSEKEEPAAEAAGEGQSAAYADAPPASKTDRVKSTEKAVTEQSSSQPAPKPFTPPNLDQTEKRGRKQTSSFDSGPATAELADLTQEQLMAKINRDISDWKTAKEKKQTPGNWSPEPGQTNTPASDALEEEERFYLEPIE